MITSDLAIIAQGQLYLENISTPHYNEIIKPNFISSAGAHMRHIIDHYLAVMSGLKTGIIDYDVRRRATSIEFCPQLTKKKLAEISYWLESLTADDLQQSIQLSTEISISEYNVAVVASSIGRELIFASSHAVHHYAMIEQISYWQTKQIRQKQNTSNKIAKNDFNPYFGLAPATASYLREQAELAGH